MTTPADLLALAARVEAATEGSRELALEIHKALGRGDPTAWIADAASHNWSWAWIEPHPEVPGGAGEYREGPLPDYITSLDAAITTIRPRCGWRVHADDNVKQAVVFRGLHRGHHSTAATPPLAVVAASFKERAA